MSKEKQGFEKIENTENTENTKNEVKAKAGTSPQARAKALVMSLATSFKENLEALTNAGIIFVEQGEVEDLAGIFSKGKRGIPLPMQIEAMTSEMNDILRSALVVDGLLSFTPEQQKAYDELAANRYKAQAKLAKAKEKEIEPA